MIRELAPRDVDLAIAHQARMWSEPDDVRSRPFGSDVPFDAVARAERYRTSWAKGLGELGWNRMFGLFDGDAMVGHCDLRGGNITSELHRATLGIGIQHGHRDRGNGRALCGAAIAWARQQGLSWIDLGVFSANARAIALYRKLGFIEIGVTRDRFRVDGESLDDISMALAL